MADGTAQFPAKLQPLFEAHRFKVLYGGRDGAKSWSVARALIAIGASRPIRWLCAREIQDSIDQSVYRLLLNQIKALGLSAHYTATKTSILGIVPETGALTGTEFNFTGLKHKIESVKSAEAYDGVWVEEAQSVSDDSWSKLIPTIRKDGSEIWVTFNPELDTDPTYVRFVINTPPDCVLIKMNHTDNPWASKALIAEREALRAKSPDDYAHIWEGHCKQVLTGAVYADEIRAATSEGRICKVPYFPGKGVHVFADLGWSDYLSLWFVQKVGMEYRMLRAYQNRHKLWDHYLQIIQESGFTVDTIWLPFDGANGSVNGKSIEQQTRDAGRKCRIVNKLSIVDGINAVRTLFPAIYFDEAGCADGLQAIRRYVWEESKNGIATREPKHDDASHYADALRYLAVGFSEPIGADERATKVINKLKRKVDLNLQSPGGGWMG